MQTRVPRRRRRARRPRHAGRPARRAAGRDRRRGRALQAVQPAVHQRRGQLARPARRPALAVRVAAGAGAGASWRCCRTASRCIARWAAAGPDRKGSGSFGPAAVAPANVAGSLNRQRQSCLTPIARESADAAPNDRQPAGTRTAGEDLWPESWHRARAPRLEFPGALYHVTARGVQQASIFLDEVDRVVNAAHIGRRAARFRRAVVRFLPDGQSLPPRPPDPSGGPVAVVMHRINATYCRSFNQRHGRHGQVFEGRFKAAVVDRDNYLLAEWLAATLTSTLSAPVWCSHPVAWRWSKLSRARRLDCVTRHGRQRRSCRACEWDESRAMFRKE